MNAKKCRAARRLARQLSSGMPERQLLAKVHKVKDTREGKTIEYEVHQAVNNPRSTRGVYRQIKNLLRRGVSLVGIEKQSKPASPV